MPIHRLCNACGRGYECPGRSTGKCPDCQRRYERDKSARRRATSTATRTRGSTAWQHMRELARARDGGCTYRNQGGCNGALAVHHIVPLEQGGTNQLDNLVTVCRAHHEQVEKPVLLDGARPTQLSAVREKHCGEGPSVA
jgi:5-methylcytosine-specific restriction endonuclease McrA